ncbi:hypothetical protein HDU91_000236, partial [Kappamyces sp. JEL0680]
MLTAGESEIDRILGQDFFQDINNTQTDATLDRIEYKDLLVAWRNEMNSPELLEYKELLVSNIREHLAQQ